MNPLLQLILEKNHHVFRKTIDWAPAQDYAKAGLTPSQRMADRFVTLCSLEEPVLLPGEKICFMRTVSNLPSIFTQEEWLKIKSEHFIHELGFLSNLCPDYASIIQTGLEEKRKTADADSIRCIDALMNLANRYRLQAEKEGKIEIAEVLKQVPRYGARNFTEALQFFRILHYALWLEGNYHNTIGRFDLYMGPYLEKDLNCGRLNEASALELLEDFFISFNKDSDLYPGVQQGDNGQSMMLGGRDAEGRPVFNRLSRLCLKASCELKLIDPKINLRVDAKTDREVFELGSELTRVGLGFPQYSNDDIIIPALERLGYTREDAANYTVAACWEFIIPSVGADVANIAALSFPKAVDLIFQKQLRGCKSFDAFMQEVYTEIGRQCEEICSKLKNLYFVPSPFMNVLFGCDVSKGAKYNNFGIHGTGISTAADSLAALKKLVFEEHRVTPEDYLDAVNSNFEHHPELLPLLRYEMPKMGQNDAFVDDLAVGLLDSFADALEGKINDRGGVYRAGTGSAMYYLWHAAELGASPDGRRKGEPFGTNFSCSLFARVPGPLSVIQSFCKPHLMRTANGGPLTLEFASGTFDKEDSLHKLAQLVYTFVRLGGHQLQLNAINTQQLLEAQRNPEAHRQLVVRVWGWSAYFVELDREYQNHVLARQQYLL